MIAADPVLGATPRRTRTRCTGTRTAWSRRPARWRSGTAARRPAEGFRAGRLAWGVQFHPEVDQAAVDGWYAAWGDVLAPAGVTEAGARGADARHLPGQAALWTAIFGAFVRLVRTPAGRSAHA